jgi:hypothetical protein
MQIDNSENEVVVSIISTRNLLLILFYILFVIISLYLVAGLLFFTGIELVYYLKAILEILNNRNWNLLSTSIVFSLSLLPFQVMIFLLIRRSWRFIIIYLFGSQKITFSKEKLTINTRIMRKETSNEIPKYSTVKVEMTHFARLQGAYIGKRESIFRRLFGWDRLLGFYQGQFNSICINHGNKRNYLGILLNQSDILTLYEKITKYFE